jgi:hypothetical protein
MKKLPKHLLDKQESERAATVSAVTDAIIGLMAQGYSPRIKDIMSVTGLSRSVFAKPHIRRVLVEYGIVEPSDIEPPREGGKTRRDIKMIIAEKDGYIDRLLFENDQLRHECEILRGEIHLLTHRISIMDNNDF